MISYILTFVGTIFCTFFAQKSFEKDKKRRGIIFSIIAVLLPSILAGLRDLSIGVDVNVYVNPFFEKVEQTKSIITLFEEGTFEPLYIVLNYIVSIISDDVHVLMFIVQLITFGLIYMAIYDNRKKMPMWLGVAVYLLMFFNTTLNIVRQSLAISVVIYGVKYVKEHKIFNTIVTIIIGILFHTTAIIAIPIYLLIYLQSTKLSEKNKLIINIIIVSMIMAAVMNYETIIQYCTYNIGILPTKYFDYLYSEYASDTINFNFFYIGFKAFWIILLIFQNNIKNIKTNKEMLWILVIDLCVFTISFKISNASRIAYYFGYTGMILGMPTTINMFKNDKYNRLIISLFLLTILFSYWNYTYVYMNYSSTYPYKLGI